MSSPHEETETAREDLLVLVAAIVCGLATLGMFGAVIWNDIDKFFVTIGIIAVWSCFSGVVYAVKSNLW